MPYSRIDKFNSERNFTQLHFGRTPLSEIELNEMQKILLEQTKNGVRLLLNDGLINVRRFDITNNILILEADGAVIQGQAIIFKEPITLVLPQTHSQLNVYFKVYEVVVKHDDQVPKYGNRNSSVLIPLRDILDDNLQGEETARRIQIQYELLAIAGTDTTSDKKLTLGTISANKTLTKSLPEIKGIEALEAELVSYIDDQIEGLSTVATSGSYNDLTNRPTLGNVASRNTGTTNGTIPIIGSDNKIDASILPAIAITETFVVNSQNAMLSLTAQIGDIAVRTDLSKSFILKGTGASSLANWQELLTPVSPVQSVSGKTGAVSLTNGDVGLGNVDNTSDLNKPISTATQTALNAKADISTLTSHTGDTNIHVTASEKNNWNAKASTSVATTSANGLMASTDKTKLDGVASGANNYVHPTTDGSLHVPATSTTNNGKFLKAGSTAGSLSWATVDKTSIGLGNVDNTSDLNKPLSTATQNALNDKAGLATATTLANGLMASADKTKLDGIAANANNYSLPNATASVLGGVKTGTNITNSSGTISVPTASTTTDGVMSSADKVKLDGIATNANNYSLPAATTTTRGGVITGTNITNSSGTISVPNASTTVAGVMSAADKTKLDDIATGANNYVLPEATSSTLGGVKVGGGLTFYQGSISVAPGSVNIRGLVQLSDAVNSPSTTLAATANAVRQAYDRANEAFQSASDGKTRIAQAITGKGITTQASATFQQMATNISNIETGLKFASGDLTATTNNRAFTLVVGGTQTWNTLEIRNLTFAPKKVMVRAYTTDTTVIFMYDSTIFLNTCWLSTFPTAQASGITYRILHSTANPDRTIIYDNGFWCPIILEAGATIKWTATS